MRQRLLIIIALLGIGCAACQQLPVRDFEQTVEGSYDVETRYDMKALSGNFSGLAGQWSQPDQAIHSEIVGTVRSEYGSTVADAFVSTYGSQLQSDITGYLNSEAPGWVMNIDSRLGLVDEQMKNVDMQSSWLLTESGGQIEGTKIYNGVAVFEDPTCPTSGGIACDQVQVSTQELLDAEYPVEIASSTYTAVETGDALLLDSHAVNFNYGRLGLYLLTNLILPDDPTEGVGLRDVVLAAINCRGLAGRLAGDDGTLGVDVGGVTVGLSLNDLIGNCEEGVFATTNSFVDRFNVPMEMNLTGSATLIDTNRDARIDQLTGGQVEGDATMQLFGQSEGGPVSGKFTGFRVGDVD